VVHHVSSPAFAANAPYVVANVIVDGTAGRVRLMSNIVGCPWEDVRVGMPVRVFFEDVAADISVPKFRPA
jgi:uncharacterized OB-fold protein